MGKIKELTDLGVIGIIGYVLYKASPLIDRFTTDKKPVVVSGSSTTPPADFLEKGGTFGALKYEPDKAKVTLLNPSDEQLKIFDKIVNESSESKQKKINIMRKKGIIPQSPVIENPKVDNKMIDLYKESKNFKAGSAGFGTSKPINIKKNKSSSRNKKKKRDLIGKNKKKGSYIVTKSDGSKEKRYFQ